jgi:hypothetical protein
MSLLLIVNEALLGETPSVLPEVLAYVRENRKKDAVRLLSAKTRLGLSDALDAVDHHLQGNAILADCAPTSLAVEVQKALQRGDKVQAIALLRAAQSPAQAQTQNLTGLAAHSVVAEPVPKPEGLVRRMGKFLFWVVVTFGAIVATLLFALRALQSWFRSTW